MRNYKSLIARRIAVLFVFAVAAIACSANAGTGHTVELGRSTANQCNEAAPEVVNATVPMICMHGVWAPTKVGF